MTSPDPTKEPQDNAEWARATDARIASLENSSAVRVGPWVLSSTAEGNLIASYVDGGSVVLAKKPTEGETDPDKIEDPVNPACTVVLNSDQSIPTRGTVVFDGVLVEVGGNWTAGSRNISAITCPVAGTYCVMGVMHITGVHASTDYGVGVAVNGQIVAGGVYGEESSSGAHNAMVSANASIVVNLTAGDAISLEALVRAAGGSSTTNIGASTKWTPAAPTSLSAWMIAKGDL